MKILITGATGFVGRNLLLQLLKDDHYDEIILLVRNENKLREQLNVEGYESLPQKITVINASAPHWLEKSVEVDHVVHSAGILMAPSEKDYLETNVEGTLNLLEKVRAKRIVLLSSHAAAGPCPEGTEFLTESDEENPVTWYGKSKLEMEKQVAEKFPNSPYLILRPPMILGPRDTASLPLFFLGKQFFQVKPGTGEKYYSYISVTDLVTAIRKTLDESIPLTHQKYFVCEREPITDRKLIETVTATFNKPSRIIPIPQGIIKIASIFVEAVPAWRKKVPNLSADRAKEIWPSRWVVSPEAFEKTFNWQAQEDLSRTLEKTHQWYQQSGQL